MADLSDFFTNYLPGKLEKNPDLAGEINAIYVFDVADFGQYTVDLTSGSGSVAEGGHDNPGCTVSAAKADFEGLLDNPSSGTMMFMTGKLKVTNVGLAMALQKLLS